MSPSATPATQKRRGAPVTSGDQGRHQSQPSAVSATPATQNKGRCRQEPRLPHKTKADVTKRHACHAKEARGDQGRHHSQPSAVCATPATQNEGSHACHTKRRQMSPRATPATQKGHGAPATSGDQGRRQSQPSAVSATPASQNEGRWRQSATPATQNESRCHQAPRLPHKRGAAPQRPAAAKAATRVPFAPRLPRKTKADVTKRHACHTKRMQMSPRATPATQKRRVAPATSGDQGGHQSQPSAACATPATQNEGRCHQAPRLPHKRRRQMSPSATLVSATTATQNEGKCHQVPRLPHKTKADVTKRHARHAKEARRPSDQR
eukprot:s2810_g13.t1